MFVVRLLALLWIAVPLVAVSDSYADSKDSKKKKSSIARGPYLQRGTPNEVTVRWRTVKPEFTVVTYSSDPNVVEAGDGRVATHGEKKKTEHEVRLTDLSPSTKYYYSAGRKRHKIRGSFVTAPPPGTDQPVRIWVQGDPGTGKGKARDVERAYRDYTGDRHTDVWLILGDNAYPDGKDKHYQKGLFRPFKQMLRHHVLWPTIGNHDEIHPGPNNDYYEFFTLPEGGEAGGVPSGTEEYYSFNYGPVHFVCLDSENTVLEEPEEMLEWLRKDLRADDSAWRIAFWHQPPYSKGSHDSDDDNDGGGRMVAMRTKVLPVLEKEGVDLVLTGHSHTYERSSLLHGLYEKSKRFSKKKHVVSGGDGDPDGDGPYRKASGFDGTRGTMYVVCGSSGDNRGGPLDHPVMVAGFDKMGSLVIDVDGDRLDLRFLGSKGKIRDHAAIVKQEEIRRASH